MKHDLFRIYFRVRCQWHGWVIIDKTKISEIIHTAPNCITLGMASGTHILLSRKDADALLPIVLPDGLWKKAQP